MKGTPKQRVEMSGRNGPREEARGRVGTRPGPVLCRPAPAFLLVFAPANTTSPDDPLPFARLASARARRGSRSQCGFNHAFMGR